MNNSAVFTVELTESGARFGRRMPLFIELHEERERQEEKFPGQQTHNSLNDWIVILGEEFGEVCRAVYELGKGNRGLEDGMDDIRMECIQVAAVAVAMVEAIDSILA